MSEPLDAALGGRGPAPHLLEGLVALPKEHSVVLTTATRTVQHGPRTPGDAFENRRQRLIAARRKHTADKKTLTLRWTESDHAGGTTEITLAYQPLIAEGADLP